MNGRGLYAYAVTLHRHGMTPLPVRRDGSKSPGGGQWKQWQTQRPGPAELSAWFEQDASDGIGILTGAPSGGVTMLEVEGRAVHLVERIAARMAERGLGDLWARLDGGWVERSPSGGIHWHYRAEVPRPNTKLARRPGNTSGTVDVLVETRGSGGFTILAPSNGRTHASGRPWVLLRGGPATCPTITADEQDLLFAVAAEFDEMPAIGADTPRPPAATGHAGSGRSGQRPGDDFNARADWGDILGSAGWTRGRAMGDGYAWTRPGKSLRDGISATTGQSGDGVDRLYVFSTSTEFDTEKPYSKFAAWAVINGYGSDLGAAARDLASKGYGERRPERGTPWEQRGHLDDLATRPATREGDETPESAPDPPGDAVADFWASRPILAHIRASAYARMCSPWAVLGVTLVRVLDAVPCWVKLPPIIGSAASLNTFVGLVGSSGAGKGSATGVSFDAVAIPHHDAVIVPPGSGEGITRIFAEAKRDGQKWVVERTNYAAIFKAEEVDSLTSLGGRQGATLDSMLRSMWSGEQLGFQYADREKRIIIPAHEYRAGMIVGIQPERAAPLFAQAGGGTPQRFLWLPAEDREVSVTPPPMPTQARIARPVVRREHIMGVPAVAVSTIRENYVARVRGDGADALDGHALLAREKVAAALAVMDGRIDIDESDWDLSGVVMAVSDATRARAQAVLADQGRRSNVARALADIERADVAAAHVEEAVDRVAERLLEALREAPDGLSRHAAKHLIASRSRRYFDDAVDALGDAVETVPGRKQGSVRYRIADA